MAPFPLAQTIVNWSTMHCLFRCRVPSLIDEYSWAGFEVHHFPVDAGGVPTLDECSSLIKQLRQCISFGRKTILQ